MKPSLLYAALLVYACTVSVPAADTVPMSEILTVKPSPLDGFAWPYYLYLPPTAEAKAANGETVYLLVSTNNTGQALDRFLHHECAALRHLTRLAREGVRFELRLPRPRLPAPGRAGFDLHSRPRPRLPNDHRRRA